jgi:[pyruvate, water dikinase]-phosphate phosphotransferase / [pyruvate, water dikinase] kinase
MAFHLHLVSDSTGETVEMVATAAVVQFKNLEPIEHVWNMVRNSHQVVEAIAGIKENPGFVLYTLVSADLRRTLEEGCRSLQVPCIALLDPIVAALGAYLGAEVRARPGRQHVMNAEYFDRIEAMHFVLGHDDGHATDNLETADVILLGVSRTSKTPTCIYLANRGVKAANVPIVPGLPLPESVMKAVQPLKIGLTTDPRRLIQLRRNRLRLLNEDEESAYVNMDSVVSEINAARRLFAAENWPVIDVTRRSVEETAANILQLLARRCKTSS